MTKAMKASVLYPSQCFLGEGPLWHAGRNSCFWVDIEEKKFFEYQWAEKSVKVRNLDLRVSALMLDKNNDLLLGMEGGLARYQLVEEKLDWLLDIEKEKHKHRCNDGKVDSRGRLWLGTLHRDFDPGTGSLYCIGNDLVLNKKLDQLTISNGLAWSSNNGKLYFIDSPTNKVQAFIFDEEKATIAFESDAIHIPKEWGSPDGMAIDEEGMLWIAHWGGFGVYRWNPNTGKLIEKIELPVPNVSSCAFVGPQLDHLLITTARQDLTEQELIKYPESGNVFLQKVSVQGTLTNKAVF